VFAEAGQPGGLGEKDEFTLGELAAVKGFKKLDPAKQKLVQMADSGGLVCVGVRDDEDGSVESGWAPPRSGVGYIDHGDHGHWTFKKRPEVIDSRLDKKQGNPAHLYLYDGRFFLANDRLNGYTRIDPKDYEDGGKGKPAASFSAAATTSRWRWWTTRSATRPGSTAAGRTRAASMSRP
jgi:hypothetical protein